MDTSRETRTRASARARRAGGTVWLALLLAGCATGTTGIAPRGLPPASLPLDLARYMGDWYVVAHIPLEAEAEAHEALERYALREDGTIDVTFRFCEGSLEGPPRTITMRAWVHDPGTNAEWRVRPFWPLSLRYQILELDPDYETTVVGSGDHAWVMARRPGMAEAELSDIVARLAERGLDVAALRRVPHGDGSCRGAGVYSPAWSGSRATASGSAKTTSGVGRSSRSSGST